jgi:hypothetical protein
VITELFESEIVVEKDVSITKERSKINTVDNITSPALDDVETIKLEGKFTELFKIKVFRINMIVLIIVWSVSALDYYLINF